MGASAEARQYHITGSFREEWKQYLYQDFHEETMANHVDGKLETLCFAEALAPRRIYVALKVKRISDIDNVNETYRCRFHIYFDWLLSQHDYEHYKEYHKKAIAQTKKLEWIPPFRPRYDFLNIVEAHTMEEVDYGTEGQYRVQQIKDFEQKFVGFDPKRSWMCRMKLEVDATFCEELELQNFPVDCQDFSIVMRESWGSRRAIFVPELRLNTRGEVPKPSDFARVDPTFSVLDEWDFHNARIEFRTSDPKQSRSESQYHLLTIRFKMRRKYTVYVFNYVLYMMFIAGLSLCCFLIHKDTVGERMGMAVTLLLTAVAFQDIVFEELPNVAYLTLLHQYILSSFIFIACVVLETAFVLANDSSGIDDEGIDDLDRDLMWIFISAFIVYHIYFLVMAAWKRHEESRKLYMDSEQLEKYVEDRKHKFKLAWQEKPKFGGEQGRLALFVDENPDFKLEQDEEELTRIDSFCKFLCLGTRWCICSCLKCRCLCKKKDKLKTI